MTSKEARAEYKQFQEVKQAFAAQLWGNEGEFAVDSEDVRFSIKRDRNGDIFVSVDSEMFSKADDPKTIVKVLSQIVKEKFTDFIKGTNKAQAFRQLYRVCTWYCFFQSWR